MHVAFRSKVNILVSLLVISSACLALVVSARSGVYAASSHISLSTHRDHPSASVKVIGKAFGVSEVVSITFDTTSVGTATTDGTGAFVTKITIPSSALPGVHKHEPCKRRTRCGEKRSGFGPILTKDTRSS